MERDKENNVWQNVKALKMSFFIMAFNCLISLEGMLPINNDLIIVGCRTKTVYLILNLFYQLDSWFYSIIVVCIAVSNRKNCFPFAMQQCHLVMPSHNYIFRFCFNNFTIAIWIFRAYLLILCRLVCVHTSAVNAVCLICQ